MQHPYEDGWLSLAIRTVGTVAIITVILWASIFISRCVAQCAPDIEHRSQEITVDGDDGVWFHERVAACLLLDIEELQLVRVRVGLLTDRLRLRDEQYSLLQEAVTQGTQALEDGQLLIGQLTDRATRAEASKRLWQWLGLLWGGLGVTVVLLIGIVI